VVALAGTQSSVDTTRRFDGAGAWSDDGLSRTRLAPVLDGDIVRRLDVGQVAYVYRGGVTFLQIKRLTGKQAAIGRGSVATAPAGPADPADGAAGRPADLTRPAAGAADGARRPSRWLADADASGEPPTMPLPVIGADPRAAAFSGAAFPGAEHPAVFGRWAGAFGSGEPSLPDVSEVLDDAFGARRD
jgi:hypothetical protein